MDDDDPQAVKCLLLYLYTFDYPEEDDCDVPVTMYRSYTPPVPSAATEAESIFGTVSGWYDGFTPHDPRMMNNVLVYAIAEKYDIPELKDLAKHKFHTLASSKWPHDDFHAVTEAVFSTTPETDMGLRQIVMDICGEHSEDILRDKESRAMFFEEKAIAAVILDAAVRKTDQLVKLLDGALAEQVTLGKVILEAEEGERIALKQNSAWTSQLDVLLRKTVVPRCCQHCGRIEGWDLERADVCGVLGMQLRCLYCRSKHDPVKA